MLRVSQLSGFNSGATSTTPTTVSFLGSDLTPTETGAAQTTHSVSAPTENSERWIYIAIAYRDLSALSGEATTMSVNSISMEFLNSISFNDSGDIIYAEIWLGLVPSGTTLTIVTNWEVAASTTVAVAAYSAIGVLDDHTKHQYDFANNAGTAAGISNTLDLPVNGFCISCAASVGSTGTYAWTNSTESMDSAVGTSFRMSTALVNVPAGQVNRVITGTQTGSTRKVITSTSFGNF